MSSRNPTVVGVLEIVAGALHMVSGTVVFLAGGAAATGLRMAGLPEQAVSIPLPLVASLGLPLAICGILALLGGISALRRKHWGLSMTGAICALVPLQTLLGVVSMVFLSLCRDEFAQDTLHEQARDTVILTQTLP